MLLCCCITQNENTAKIFLLNEYLSNSKLKVLLHYIKLPNVSRNVLVFRKLSLIIKKKCMKNAKTIANKLQLIQFLF